MPNLQDHQLRVAAVAQQICNSLNISVNADEIILACLLHDMGNIIKSKFDNGNNLFSYSDDELTYWQAIKEEFVGKYGDDENKATEKIIKELEIDKKISDILAHTFIFQLPEIDHENDMTPKIVKYSDLRVGLHGIVSLEERLEDARVRYPGVLTEEIEIAIHHIEKEIFSHSKLKPEDITDESSAKYIEELKNFEI